MTRHWKAWIGNHELEIFSSNPCLESRILTCVASHVSSQTQESKNPKWIYDFFGSKTEGFRKVFGREHVFCVQGPVQGPDPSFFLFFPEPSCQPLKNHMKPIDCLCFPKAGQRQPTGQARLQVFKPGAWCEEELAKSRPWPANGSAIWSAT